MYTQICKKPVQALKAPALAMKKLIDSLFKVVYSFAEVKHFGIW